MVEDVSPTSNGWRMFPIVFKLLRLNYPQSHLGVSAFWSWCPLPSDSLSHVLVHPHGEGDANIDSPQRLPDL